MSFRGPECAERCIPQLQRCDGVGFCSQYDVVAGFCEAGSQNHAWGRGFSYCHRTDSVDVAEKLLCRRTRPEGMLIVAGHNEVLAQLRISPTRVMSLQFQSVSRHIQSAKELVIMCLPRHNLKIDRRSPEISLLHFCLTCSSSLLKGVLCSAGYSSCPTTAVMGVGTTIPEQST